MDPVSLIVAAVVAGAAAAAKDVTADAVTQAWGRLKLLLRDRFGTDSAVGHAVAETETAPDTGGENLKTALDRVGVEHDKELLAAARAVLQQTGSLVENVSDVDADAAVEGSGQTIALAGEAQGTVRNKQQVGRSANVKDSPQRITIGSPSEDPSRRD